MSSTSTEVGIATEHVLFTYVQVVVATVALYDHALTLGREIDFIWKTPSLVTVLYIIDRYLGDAVLLAGVSLCFRGATTDNNPLGLQLFQFRAWGTLAYSWATQGIMQLRIYAMYRRSRKILTLLLVCFAIQITVVIAVVWRATGPAGVIEVITGNDHGDSGFCAFIGVERSFSYLFIPVLCFECLLFVLVARVYYENVRHTSRLSVVGTLGGLGEINSFARILARDSLFYFFVNLVMLAVVMGLWQSPTARYANFCIPFVMLLEILVGTRLVINFRERFNGPGRAAAVVSGRYNAFAREEDGGVPMNKLRIKISYEIETMVDGEFEFDRVFGEQKCPPEC